MVLCAQIWLRHLTYVLPSECQNMSLTSYASLYKAEFFEKTLQCCFKTVILSSQCCCSQLYLWSISRRKPECFFEVWLMALAPSCCNSIARTVQSPANAQNSAQQVTDIYIINISHGCLKKTWVFQESKTVSVKLRYCNIKVSLLKRFLPFTFKLFITLKGLQEKISVCKRDRVKPAVNFLFPKFSNRKRKLNGYTNILKMTSICMLRTVPTSTLRKLAWSWTLSSLGCLYDGVLLFYHNSLQIYTEFLLKIIKAQLQSQKTLFSWILTPWGKYLCILL